MLVERNVNVEWVIIGNGELKEYLLTQWNENDNIEFFSFDKNIDVLKKMMICDIFVLPTQFEGYGISIVEALSCGLVPIVTDVAGGTREILKNVGFLVQYRDTKAYADLIQNLSNDRNLLQKLQNECRELAVDQYDIKITAYQYFLEFMQFTSTRKNKLPKIKVKVGSFLDKPIFPNCFVKFARNFLYNKL